MARRATTAAAGGAREMEARSWPDLEAKPKE